MVNTDGDLRYLRESAARVGVDIDATQTPFSRETVDTSAGHVSWLRWGQGPVGIVAAHGGGQNAHTWDSFSFALGRPILCVDLPGHGHSAWRADRDYYAQTNAATLAEAFDAAGMTSLDFVGMSLGGLTGIALAADRPDLVRRLVLVDVSPGVRRTYDTLRSGERGTTGLVVGQRVFESLDAMIDAAVVSSPSRTRESLMIGTYYNSKQNTDGTWSWKYDVRGSDDREPYDRLWEALAVVQAETLLVLGGESRFVSEEDAARLLDLQPTAGVVTVPGAGHSVQGDKPVDLANIVREFLDKRP